MKMTRLNVPQILAILRQAEIRSWAWRRFANRCSLRHSFRRRPSKLSTNPFCITARQGIAKQCPQRGFAWRDVVTLDLSIFLPFQNGIRRQFGAPSRQICLANRLPGNGYR